MSNAWGATTPFPAGYVLVESKEQCSPEFRKTYQSIIGSLLYIMLVLQFFLFCFVYLCLFIISRSESWCCHFDSLLFDSYRCHTIDQEIEAYLAIYCASHPKEWLTALHTLEFTHNNCRHANRQKTPFELMFGDSPQAIPHSFENTRFPAVEAKMKQLWKNREEALAAHKLAWTWMIEQRRSRFTPFRKGDKVWLDSRNLQMLYHKKMAPRWERPFEIVDILGLLTYRLKLPEMWRIHNV